MGGVQMFAAFSIIAWVATLSILIFLILKRSDLLRLSDDFQDAGADFIKHSPKKSYASEGDKSPAQGPFEFQEAAYISPKESPAQASESPFASKGEILRTSAASTPSTNTPES